MKPPPRLLLDPESSFELRADLKRVAEEPPHYDVAAGLAAFEVAAGLTTLTQTTAAAHGASATQAASSSTAAGAKLTTGAAAKAATSLSALKLGGLAAATIAVVTAVSFGVRTPSPIDATATSAPHVAPAPASPPPRTASAEPTGSTLAPQLESQAREAEAPRSRHGTARTAHEGSALRRETLQLGRVRDALNAGRAHDAYALAEAGHREFKAGMHWQEREGLATLALYELGRKAQADQRARELLERYPNCAVRAELEERLRAHDAP
jgi:hypothetical protein